MAIFNYQKKEIGAKIVYYGPALCGKTTNVQYIHLKLNPKQRGELVSLATDCDRTLFFDFLPIELENIGGFKTRFHIYTVPGQVYYNSTRKAVLTGVDGIVFVADSQRSMAKENVESLENLKENLQYYNRDMDSIPLIFQYNKQDMPDVMSVEELNNLLNPRGLPFFEAVAIKGTGVLPTLTSCCKLVLQNLKQKSAAAARPERPQPEPAAAAPAEKPPLRLRREVPRPETPTRPPVPETTVDPFAGAGEQPAAG
ncbi:MAG: GTPase, partial [Deltaproteobacteria bacterium]|nr:GTPase [Deltaproteobacteria bacterium]